MHRTHLRDRESPCWHGKRSRVPLGRIHHLRPLLERARPGVKTLAPDCSVDPWPPGLRTCPGASVAVIHSKDAKTARRRTAWENAFHDAVFSVQAHTTTKDLRCLCCHDLFEAGTHTQQSQSTGPSHEHSSPLHSTERDGKEDTTKARPRHVVPRMATHHGKSATCR